MTGFWLFYMTLITLFGSLLGIGGFSRDYEVIADIVQRAVSEPGVDPQRVQKRGRGI